MDLYLNFYLVMVSTFVVLHVWMYTTVDYLCFTGDSPLPLILILK